MSESKRVRISVTFTKPYLDGLDALIKKGIYIDRGSVIREALRTLFSAYGLKPFYPEGEAGVE